MTLSELCEWTDAGRGIRRACLERRAGRLPAHFLLNALNTVTTLVRRGDSRPAIQTIARLGEILRYAVRENGDRGVPLRDELAAIRTYVAVERARFADRLEVAIEVDAAVEDARVPRLLLQPLVENAIRHGLGPAGGGRVEIAAHRRVDRVLIQVTDDGHGPPPEGERREGVGLSATRARLELCFPGSWRLGVQRADGGGTRVAVEVPFERCGRG